MHRVFGLSRVARVHATREIETLSLSLSLSARRTQPLPETCYGSLELTQERRRRVWSVVERRIFAVRGFFCRPNDGCCFLEGVYYGGIIARGMGKYFVTMIR